MNWDRNGRDGHSNFIRWIITLCVIGIAGAAAVVIVVLASDRAASPAYGKSAQIAAQAASSGESESIPEASDFLESIPEDEAVSQAAGISRNGNASGLSDPADSADFESFESAGTDGAGKSGADEGTGDSSDQTGQDSAIQGNQDTAAAGGDAGADTYAGQDTEGRADGASTSDESASEAGENASSEASAAEAVRQTQTVERTLYFLGDSRTVGMYRAVTGRNNVTDGTVFDKDSNYFGWAASNGQGLAWAKSTGASFIDSSVGSGCAVVVLLGVNDVTGGEAEEQAYIDYLNQKAEQWKGMGGAETFWVSINPVNGTINGVDNTKIEDFNQAVRGGLSDDVWYLDTYYELSGQFDTIDRLHYTDETYQKIYDRILQDVMIRYADDGVPVSVEGK